MFSVFCAVAGQKVLWLFFWGGGGGGGGEDARLNGLAAVV
jgi:hypothetical protein